jgi:hypothetical protein
MRFLHGLSTTTQRACMQISAADPVGAHANACKPSAVGPAPPPAPLPPAHGLHLAPLAHPLSRAPIPLCSVLCRAPRAQQGEAGEQPSKVCLCCDPPSVLPSSTYLSLVLPPSLTQVALTIDDSPDHLVTEQVLSVLRQHGAHSTFFIIGGWVESAGERGTSSSRGLID